MPIYKGDFCKSNIPPVLIDNNPLLVVDKTKCLGFHINSRLDATDHVKNVVGKIYGVLRNLRLSAQFTPSETKMNLVRQLIVPFISYFVNVYCKLDSVCTHKLRVALNHSARYVFNLKRFDHVSVYSEAILGCDIITFFDSRNCLFLHKLILTKKPDYLYEKLVFGRSARCATLIPPKYKYLASSRLFYVGAIRTWNSLPVSVKVLEDMGQFKNEMITFLKQTS